MANTIQHKRSSTATTVPTAGQLSAGELAVNTADGKLYLKKDNATVVEIGGAAAAGTLTGSTLAAGVTASSLTSVGALTSLTVNNTGVKVGAHISKFLTITSDGSSSFITQGGSAAAALTISHAGFGDIYIGDSAGASNSTYINVNDGSSTITLSGAVTADEVTAASYILSSAGIQAKTASYTLVATDNGKIITMNVATANNLTVPASLAVGFNCTIIQLGAGQTTIVASSTTLNSYQGYLKISGQHGSASIVSYVSNVYNVAGSLSA